MTSTRIIATGPEATYTLHIVPRQQDRRTPGRGSGGMSPGGDLDRKYYVGNG